MDLKSHRFIAYFEPAQAAELCQLAIVESFSDQKVIFEEGETSDSIYLILDGQVAFSKRTNTNKYQTVAIAGANDFFGEFGVLDGQPRSARASTSGCTTLAKIPRDRLMEILLKTNGSVVLDVFRHLIQHLRSTTDRYVNQVVHKEKMALIGEMVNTIIHDFKGPFTGIHLASSMLKEIHADEDTQEWCEIIQTQLTRMLEMTDEVLEFGRGTPAINKQPIKFLELIQYFQKLNRCYFESEKVMFIFQSADIVISADENKLMRVFQNLVTNAVESFNGSGGRIEFVARSVQEWVEITISDNGPGIPEAIRGRVFEPFVTSGKRGGTGLGAAIAKSVVEAHGGQIYFESKSGQGTTFYIRLPA
ncbi:ATP-binding protein [Microcoleus sp. FACHB-68]|uniref:ATP-binding protein n=1 Tax=Microcoleus sp. FACHB-68 TaxID=2692826 RepID=UPI00168828D8|nr:ATP-binding protein [Microcoleus sp. FACHB-68]MBD1936031.1 cyclic nucleotide-binding domain-containing protein [Microcoleus sp. FACHB-68]